MIEIFNVLYSIFSVLFYFIFINLNYFENTLPFRRSQYYLLPEFLFNPTYSLRDFYIFLIMKFVKMKKKIDFIILIICIGHFFNDKDILRYSIIIFTVSVNLFRCFALLQKFFIIQKISILLFY